ncbi:hypothetical protein MMC25_006228 [Agyrium rufum]|nr:hypothetical protein [Agyrium rufum]
MTTSIRSPLTRSPSPNMDSKSNAYPDDARSSDSLEEEHDSLLSGSDGHIRRKSRKIAILVPLILLVSLSINLFQLVYIFIRRPTCLSLYATAKLPENEINIPFQYSTEYGSDNHDLEAKDRLWNAIDISEGMVAITHEESDSLGLPRSKTFPWDINKGMYLSHAHHAMHCTTLLHAYTYDSHRGKIPMVTYHHVEHCLDLIRQDIICHADDFMDYTKGHGDEFLVGNHQPRQCRDWSKLSEWLQQRSACYKTVNITRGGEDHGVEHQLDRYTYCPEGSPYLSVIAAWRDLNRPNPGNLAEEAVEAQTEDEAQADAKAVTEHNSNIQS